MDVSVKGEEIEVSRSVPTLETSSSEKDRSQVVLRTRFNRDKTYDNRTREIQQSQIETRTAGLQGHVCYRNGDRRVSVTRAAVCMGWKRRGCKQDTGRI